MMSSTDEIEAVLSAYPSSCRPERIEELGSAGGFSGARFWRLDAPAGRLCLRRWPKEHPTRDRLEFIQAVLWHVTTEGFGRVPLPLETQAHAGYVRAAGHLWELAPWMSGHADYLRHPSLEKLQAALAALAEFHRAAESFPLPNPHLAESPGIVQRLRQLQSLLAGDFQRISGSIERGFWPEIDVPASETVRLFPLAAEQVLGDLERATHLRVPLQPCIRDVWHDHVLFAGDEVSGLIDFGGMRPENVAADVARLLGSMSHTGSPDWQAGLAAYEAIRSLSSHELILVGAFDKSTALMAGINWLDWIYRQRREFESREAVAGRFDHALDRLQRLSARVGVLQS